MREEAARKTNRPGPVGRALIAQIRFLSSRSPCGNAFWRTGEKTTPTQSKHCDEGRFLSKGLTGDARPTPGVFKAWIMEGRHKEIYEELLKTSLKAK